MPIYIGTYRGFGCRFGKPAPSPYAAGLYSQFVRSPVTFGLLKRDVFEYVRNRNVITDGLYQEALKKTFDAFRLHAPVYSYHLNDLFDMDLECMKSSPGIPWFDYKTRRDVCSDRTARQQIRWFAHRIKNGENLKGPHCKVLCRSHLIKAGDRAKVRAIYGYSTTVTLMEACFALPLIEAYKNNSPIAYGYESLRGGCGRLWRELRPYKNFGCIDFRKFDKTVSAQLIRDAFSILEYNIDFTRYKDQGVPDASRLHNAWQWLINYFVKTPMRLCNGEAYKKFSGIPSGSFFTQLVGSIVNYILLTYSSLVFGFNIDYIRVFGDDSVIATSDVIPLNGISHLMMKLGMEINAEKSIVTSNIDEVEFLGFGIRGGLPRRTEEKWIGALVYPEHPDLDEDSFKSRALGLLYATCGVNGSVTRILREFLIGSFTLKVSRDFSRFLRQVGCSLDDTFIPSDWDLLRRVV